MIEKQHASRNAPVDQVARLPAQVSTARLPVHAPRTQQYPGRETCAVDFQYPIGPGTPVAAQREQQVRVRRRLRRRDEILPRVQETHDEQEGAKEHAYLSAAAMTSRQRASAIGRSH